MITIYRLMSFPVTLNDS